jgi:hypothetical protein
LRQGKSGLFKELLTLRYFSFIQFQLLQFAYSILVLFAFSLKLISTVLVVPGNHWINAHGSEQAEISISRQNMETQTILAGHSFAAF